jgi:DNA gyrase subunit B
MLDDYFFAVTPEGRGSKVEVLPAGECLSLDTMIPLLDGRDLSLQNIIKEFESGKQLWAYSCNPETGAIIPGIINWAGVTRQDAQVMKITLDNGETIVVTPDHKFPTLVRGTQEAKDLMVGDSMIPFNRRSQNDYTQVYDNSSKKWEFVHKMVDGYFKSHDLLQDVGFDENISYTELAHDGIKPSTLIINHQTSENSLEQTSHRMLQQTTMVT